MGHRERIWLGSNEGTGLISPVSIFAIFENEDQAITLVKYLNNRYKNLNFTKDEIINPGELPFLDIFIKNEGKLVTLMLWETVY